MLIIRWKRNGKWSNWHIAKGHGEEYKGKSYCGCTIPDAGEVGTNGLEEVETMNMITGVHCCKPCSYSYWGVRPQLKRIGNGQQSRVRAINETGG